MGLLSRRTQRQFSPINPAVRITYDVLTGGIRHFESIGFCRCQTGVTCEGFRISGKIPIVRGRQACGVSCVFSGIAAAVTCGQLHVAGWCLAGDGGRHVQGTVLKGLISWNSAGAGWEEHCGAGRFAACRWPLRGGIGRCGDCRARGLCGQSRNRDFPEN